MPSNEETTSKARPRYERIYKGHIFHFTIPSPCCINSKLSIFPELLFFFNLNLLANLLNSIVSYFSYIWVFIKQAR